MATRKRESQEQEFYALEGKLRRTVYAIIQQDLISHIATIDEEQVKYLTKKIKSAIEDAVENSLEFMIEHSMIMPVRKSRKKKARR